MIDGSTYSTIQIIFNNLSKYVIKISFTFTPKDIDEFINQQK